MKENSSAVESSEGGVTRPPGERARTLAVRTWWLSWLLGVIAIGLVVVIAVPGGVPIDPAMRVNAELPTSTHTVVYEVIGKGKSPEIKYVVDGLAETEEIEGANLPWRKELTIEVGPSSGIVQIMASNSGKAKEISCAIKVDGKTAHQAEAAGEFSAVSCSSVIRPKVG